MAYLVNDPANFTDELIDGFVAAHPSLIRRVPGGVARVHDLSPTGLSSTSPPPVALVIGGGSGHYPAFGGLVGQGLADGAAMGNIFASPSAQQVYSVARAVSMGGGVLLSYGNYSGDVLNFDRAQERLRAEGIDCRTVAVTDDISSATADKSSSRRGIAGDLTVFKCAGAAAAGGADLDEVERVAREANGRTRTIGVAFSGCTLPGASEPLFTVPAGKVAVGMGIHGEPGIDEISMPSANDLAAMLVERLWTERPSDVNLCTSNPDNAEAARMVVLVNGLGSVKTEELFVFYRAVAKILELRGVTIVEPEVGELVTSFEMAGLSLTFFWLTEELEYLWSQQAYTPAYRKRLAGSHGQSDPAPEKTEEASRPIPAASAESRDSAILGAALLNTIAQTMDTNAEELGRLDAVAGDGDHGIGMQRGSHAAALEASRVTRLGAGLGSTLLAAGEAWADRAGGTSGALWGEILVTIGDHVGDEVRPTSIIFAEAVSAATEAVSRYGGARLGDKTLLDTLIPFGKSLSRASTETLSVAEAWRASTEVARVAAEATATLSPSTGRARKHIGRSLGTPDPGAVSMSLIIEAVSEAFHLSEEHTSKSRESL